MPNVSFHQYVKKMELTHSLTIITEIIFEVFPLSIANLVFHEM